MALGNFVVRVWAAIDDVKISIIAMLGNDCGWQAQSPKFSFGGLGAFFALKTSNP